MDSDKNLTFEDLKFDKMLISSIFFYEKAAKINAHLFSKEKDEPTLVSLDLDNKDDIFDLIIFDENWESKMKLNENNNDSVDGHLPLRARFDRKKNGAIIDFLFFPIEINNIILDWIISKNIDGSMALNLKYFNQYTENNK